MSMFSFKVGTEEVHTVGFFYNRWLGQFKATVDEKPVRIINQLVIGYREMKFEIGEKERHKIRITWKMPYYGSIRKLEAKVFVDENFYEAYNF